MPCTPAQERMLHADAAGHGKSGPSASVAKKMLAEHAATRTANEGFLTDGRPYRAEYWAHEQVSSMTFFLSTKGMESYSNQQFIELLEREKLLAWRPGGFKSAYAMPFTDPSGNDMWPVNVVVGDDEQTFAVVLIPMRAYERGLPREA
jgi:hypothetical protein